MTIIMAFWGMIVFFPSLATVGFKQAFRRLAAFTLFGFSIDLSIVAFAYFINCVV